MSFNKSDWLFLLAVLSLIGATVFVIRKPDIFTLSENSQAPVIVVEKVAKKKFVLHFSNGEEYIYDEISLKKKK